ncbi:hypothetical protein RvY_14209 [Ramazzottius varieornatus]|uniref:Uncharacterized protein n=1 Tax=Ramazzottius varieornatus TaxID=947166 RepID=A0A1D1VXT5_RAMVA|nr:hypothetical protein RvY_14209 [Ramazzottius varieornatus]
MKELRDVAQEPPNGQGEGSFGNALQLDLREWRLLRKYDVTDVEEREEIQVRRQRERRKGPQSTRS